MEILNDILQLSPPIALALSLNLLALALKKSPFPDWLIPAGLIVIGAAVFPFVAEQQQSTTSCRHPEVLNAIYGACIGGLAVGLNQALRQFLGRNGNGEKPDK